VFFRSNNIYVKEVPKEKKNYVICACKDCIKQTYFSYSEVLFVVVVRRQYGSQFG
jgi:hypothetical protein